MLEKNSLSINKEQSVWPVAVEATIIAAIILIPTAFYFRNVNIFLTMKEFLLGIFIILGLAFWALKLVDRGRFELIASPLNFSLIAFMFISTLSIFWSNSPMVSLKELSMFLPGPLLYFIVINNIKNDKQINRILISIIILGSLFGLYGILQYRGIDFYFWTGNVGRQLVFGLFGNVNFFAEYLIIPLSIAIGLFFTHENSMKKGILLIGILFMGSSLILTFTRGSYLALLVSVLFMFFLFLFRRGIAFIKANRTTFTVITIIIILLLTLFFIPNPLNEPGTVISKIKGRTSVAQLSEGGSIKRRIATWKFTGLIIKDHMLLGSGLGTFKYNTLDYQAKFFNQGENREIYPYGHAERAHNEYLQTWSEMGIIGLLIFLWMIIAFFKNGIRKLKEMKNRYKQGLLIGLLGGITAILVDAIFGFPLHLPASIYLFWLSIGLVVTIKDNVPEPEYLESNQKKYLKRAVPGDKKGNQSTDALFYKIIYYLIIILVTSILCLFLARPFIAQYHYYNAHEEIKDENWDEAIKEDEKALKWDPYFGEAYYDIGKILQIKGFNNISLEYFQKAAKYIDHPDLPQEFATSYLKKGQLNQAEIWLKKAILYQKKRQTMLPLYAQLGNVYIRQRKYNQAETALNESLKIDPEFINAHYGLANIYLTRNETDAALAELKKVIELAPDSPEAKNAKNIMQKIAQDALKAPSGGADNP